MHLMSVASFGAPRTPSAGPISLPRRTASVQRKLGIVAATGLSPTGKTSQKGPPSGAWRAMPLAQPPGTPTFPVIAASTHPARTACSP